LFPDRSLLLDDLQLTSEFRPVLVTADFTSCAVDRSVRSAGSLACPGLLSSCSCRSSILRRPWPRSSSCTLRASRHLLRFEAHRLLLGWGFVWCIPGVFARIWFGSGIPPTFSVVGVCSTLSPPLQFSGSLVLQLSGSPALQFSGSPVLQLSGSPALRFSGSPVLRSGRNTCTAGAAAYHRAPSPEVL
jgi:hypothetical protein